MERGGGLGVHSYSSEVCGDVVYIQARILFDFFRESQDFIVGKSSGGHLV